MSEQKKPEYDTGLFAFETEDIKIEVQDFDLNLQDFQDSDSYTEVSFSLHF